MSFMLGNRRKSTFFEKILLVIGLIVILVGFHFIFSIFSSGQTEMWGAVSSVFLWLLLIITIVLLAISEDVKEELAIIMKQQVDVLHLIREEVKLLKEEGKMVKEITRNQQDELKLIRKELEQQRYKQH